MSTLMINKTSVNYKIYQCSISNRRSDKGYKKTIYMLSKIFLEENIKTRYFYFSILLHLFKIKRKNA